MSSGAPGAAASSLTGQPARSSATPTRNLFPVQTIEVRASVGTIERTVAPRP